MTSSEQHEYILQMKFTNIFLKNVCIFWFQFNFKDFSFFIWQQASIALGNGLALYRQQTILWTNGNPIH